MRLVLISVNRSSSNISFIFDPLPGYFPEPNIFFPFYLESLPILYIYSPILTYSFISLYRPPPLGDFGFFAGLAAFGFFAGLAFLPRGITHGYGFFAGLAASDFFAGLAFLLRGSTHGYFLETTSVLVLFAGDFDF